MKCCSRRGRAAASLEGAPADLKFDLASSSFAVRGDPDAAVPLSALAETERMVAMSLIDRAAHAAGRLVLTLRGRLLADAVIRDLT